MAPQTIDNAEPVQRALVGWFRVGHRDMPWRRTRDPYAIWISEIMLQQTRVDTVTPYFERWMARFPDVRVLAAAPLDDVLALWSGLGYYARARNLHAAARELAEHHDGRMPDDPDAVRALPGVGPYTAGAILSIAFGRAAPIVDGNVARVLARLYALAGADDAAQRRRLWQIAAALVPTGAASDFNQALMELGALVCTPRGPACARCPLEPFCLARRSGRAEAYPAPRQKATVPSVPTATVLLERGGKLLLLRRAPSGLWGGLWEPPTGELRAGERPAEAALRVVRAATGLELDEVRPLCNFEHVLTHRRLRFHAYRASARGRLRLGGPSPGPRYEASRWVSAAAPGGIGLAAWATRLLRRLDEGKEIR